MVQIFATNTNLHEVVIKHYNKIVNLVWIYTIPAIETIAATHTHEGWEG